MSWMGVVVDGEVDQCGDVDFFSVVLVNSSV